ncbi:hypothetical protein TCAL_02892 [Tigriopus californicus]|uniref:Uncharacterized protein n=2 Tax=Tigriopus californicus TaxID=6832 RepID=A0A553NYP3_TIGCA|nr:hypothetical protein TCAL_02892 [Tigriopus californicus]|eukprot:TCALIF_02891-PA protein Name:"Protein of unknown function" AED:0.02 eAED:0.02 QI:2641/1/1/1/0.85/0.75/8/788/396
MGEDISIVISDLSSLPVEEEDRDQEHSETLINRLEELVGELEEEIVKRNSWILFLGVQKSEPSLENFNPNSFVQGLHSIYHSLDNLKEIVHKYEAHISKQFAEICERESVVDSKEVQIQSVVKDNGRLLKKLQIYQQEITRLMEVGQPEDRQSEITKILDEKDDKIFELEDFLNMRHEASDHGHVPEGDLYEKIMRLEQRLQRANSNGQSADMDVYMRKLERHNYFLEGQRSSLHSEIDNLRTELILAKIKEKEVFIGWMDLHPKLHENCPDLAKFLSSLNQECKRLRKTLIQHTHQMSTDSDNELKLFPGRASISLLEREFSQDIDDDSSDVFSTCSQQSLSHSPVPYEESGSKKSCLPHSPFLHPSVSSYEYLHRLPESQDTVKNPRNRHFSFS